MEAILYNSLWFLLGCIAGFILYRYVDSLRVLRGQPPTQKEVKTRAYIKAKYHQNDMAHILMQDAYVNPDQETFKRRMYAFYSTISIQDVNYITSEIGNAPNKLALAIKIYNWIHGTHY